MAQMKMPLKIGFNYHSMAIPWWFSRPLTASLPALVSPPFHLHAKRNFGKKKA